MHCRDLWLLCLYLFTIIWFYSYYECHLFSDLSFTEIIASDKNINLFKCWFWPLKLYWNDLSTLTAFLWNIYRVFHVQHHTYPDFLLSSFDVLYLLCLNAFANVSSTILNKSAESGHPVLFQTRQEMLSAFPHSIWTVHD